MYDNMSKDHAIEYNPDIISKIKEMISEGYDKLKSFLNIKHSKFKIYHELEEKFNNITDNLKKNELFNDELHISS